MRVLKWTIAMELVLLDSMVVSVREGLRAESGFKKAAWVEALRIIVAEFPLQSALTIKQLTTKLQWYKTKWKEWLIIDDLSGWGWNAVTELHTGRSPYCLYTHISLLSSLFTKNVYILESSRSTIFTLQYTPSWRAA